MQIQVSIRTHGKHAQTDHARLDLDLGTLQDVGGELGQELVEAAVGVGIIGGFVGGHGEVCPAQAAEKTREKALLEKVDGGFPVGLAGRGQLIEITANLTSRK